MALLEPMDQLGAAELKGDYTTWLVLLEELIVMPFGAIWDYYCLQQDVPAGVNSINEIRTYERQVLALRD